MTTQTPTRDSLTRMVEFRADDTNNEASDGFNLSGFAAVFGTPTRIDSWEGEFDEEIRKGAFRKTLREREPVMQFDHGRHPLIGSIPIASIKTLREEDEGLWTEARMTDNWLIEPVRMAIAEGNIKGMSFRFDVVREKWYDNEGKELKEASEIYSLLWDPGDRGPLKRELIELRLHELGPVVFPAYAETTVGVRAREVAAQLQRNRESVRLLRGDLVRSANATIDLVREDADLRQQVASVVLWGPAAAGAPVAPKPAEKDEPPAQGTRSDSQDAPVSNDHPSTVTTPEDKPTTLPSRLVDSDALASLRRYVDGLDPHKLEKR